MQLNYLFQFLFMINIFSRVLNRGIDKLRKLEEVLRSHIDDLGDVDEKFITYFTKQMYHCILVYISNETKLYSISYMFINNL